MPRTSARESRLHHARAELVLRGCQHRPLREVGLDPDPLEPLARAFASVRSDREESATATIDLLPLTWLEMRQHRRATRRELDRADPRRTGRTSMLEQLLEGAGLQSRRSVADSLLRRQVMRDGARRMTRDLEVRVQVLASATAPDRERALQIMQGLLSAFSIYGTADRGFVVSGLDLGVAFLGSDLPVRRWWFDRRLQTGRFRPARANVVEVGEIAGLLKPPTRHCSARNVQRAGARIAPAPRDLPIYRRQRDVLPIGRAMTVDGPQVVGMHTRDFYFGLSAGRSRFGKTEDALNKLLHVALAGHGCFYLDPHSDAIERLKPFLTAPDVRERVIDLNLDVRGHEARHVGWNLLAMHRPGGTRMPLDTLADRANGIVDAFMVAAGWGKTNGRALALVRQAVTTLLHLAYRLPPDAAPTLFTIDRLLSDDAWRAAVTATLPDEIKRYWSSTFTTYGSDAIGPILNPISRLGANPGLRAVLGSPRSSWDARTAMDQRLIVLACPGNSREKFAANFLVQLGLIRPAMSRVDVPPHQRPELWAFLDELASYDDGASVPELLEQTAKYGVRVLALNQSPHRLTENTREAIVTNASVLSTTANSAKGAAFFDLEWAGLDAKLAIPRLTKYTYITQLTHGGRRCDPFRVDGLPIDEMWADRYAPDGLDELERTIDASTRPRTVAQTLRLIEGHDARIVAAVRASRRARDRPDAPSMVADGSIPGGYIVRHTDQPKGGS